MSKRKLIAVTVVIIAVLAASVVGIQRLVSREKVNGAVIDKPAIIKNTEIIILESFPIQANVVVYGEFSDSCTEILKITTSREGSTFLVTIITRRPIDAVCAQVITPFKEVVPLYVVGLRKGIYTVDVNGVKGTFELQADNIIRDVGFLEGKVQVGPLCPVEPCNLTEDQIARAYEARKIVVHSSDRSSEVASVSLDQTGSYRIALKPGQYIVDINRIGIDSSSDLPKEVLIESGKTVELDIRIDTGIR